MDIRLGSGTKIFFFLLSSSDSISETYAVTAYRYADGLDRFGGDPKLIFITARSVAYAVTAYRYATVRGRRASKMVIEILNGVEILVICKFKSNKNLNLNLHREILRNSNPIKISIRLCTVSTTRRSQSRVYQKWLVNQFSIETPQITSQ